MGSYDESWAPHELAVSDGYAYVATEDELRVLDVSSPSRPAVGGQQDIPSGISPFIEPVGISLVGQYAYIPCARADALLVVDVSAPSDPKLIGSYSVPQGSSGSMFGTEVEGVSVFEKYAYAAVPDSVLVLDMSIPSKPMVLGSVGVERRTTMLATVGDCIYRVVEEAYPPAEGEPGLQVLDINEPTSPRPVRFLETPGTVSDIATARVDSTPSWEHRAYLASPEVGLLLLDVSEPSQPTLVSSYDLPGGARSVAASGSRVYVVDAEHILRVIDLSEPSSPSEVGTYGPTKGGVEVADSHIFVVDRRAGLTILQDKSARVTDPEATSSPTPTATPAQLGMSSPWPMRRHDAQHTGSSPSTGPEVPQLQWVYKGQARISNAVIGPDGTVYLDGGEGFLVGADPTGTYFWFHSLPEQSTPLLALTENGLLCAAQGTDFHAIRLSDSTKKWTYSTGGPINDFAIAANGTAYIASERLHAIDPTDGTRKWVSSDSECQQFESVAVGPSSTVYGLSLMDVCVYTPEGELRWSEWTAPGARGFNTAITVGPAGTIYVNGEAASSVGVALPTRPLKILDPDGQIADPWEDFMSHPPAVSPEGICHLGLREVGEVVETDEGVLTAEVGPPQLLARSLTTGGIWTYALEERLCGPPTLGAR